MGRLLADRFGLFAVVTALVAGLVVPAAGEDLPGVPDSVTLSRWEYLELSYRSMSCGMRCGSEPAMMHCESHILRTADGGIAEFVFWWRPSDLAVRDLRSRVARVNARLPVMFHESLPARQGIWPAGSLESRLLIVHKDGEKGEIIGMFCGRQGGFSPREIAAVEKEIRDRGAVPVY